MTVRVLTLVLRNVERLIGTLDQGVPNISVVGEYGNPEAYRDRADPGNAGGFGDGPQPLCDPVRTFDTGLRHDDAELLSSDPTGNIDLTELSLEDLSDCTQYSVST